MNSSRTNESLYKLEILYRWLFTLAVNIFPWRDEGLCTKNPCLTAKPCHRKASGILSLRFQHIFGAIFILICNKNLIPQSALDLLESDLQTSFLRRLPGITGRGKSCFKFLQALTFPAASTVQRQCFYLLGSQVHWTWPDILTQGNGLVVQIKPRARVNGCIYGKE